MSYLPQPISTRAYGAIAKAEFAHCIVFGDTHKIQDTNGIFANGQRQRIGEQIHKYIHKPLSTDI